MTADAEADALEAALERADARLAEASHLDDQRAHHLRNRLTALRLQLELGRFSPDDRRAALDRVATGLGPIVAALEGTDG